MIVPLSQIISVSHTADVQVKEQHTSTNGPSGYRKIAIPLSLDTLGLTNVIISAVTLSGVPNKELIQSMGCAESSAHISRLYTGLLCHVSSNPIQVWVLSACLRRTLSTFPSSWLSIISFIFMFCGSTRICQAIVKGTEYLFIAATIRSPCSIVSAIGFCKTIFLPAAAAFSTISA